MKWSVNLFATLLCFEYRTEYKSIYSLLPMLFTLGIIKFLVPINIHSFVFSPYKIKSHFLVPVTFSLSILGTRTVAGNFLQGLKVLMEKFIGTKNADENFYRD